MPAIPKYTSRDRQSIASTIDINEPLRMGQAINTAIGGIGEGLYKAAQAEQLIDEKITAYNEKKELQNAELQFIERSQNAMNEVKEKYANDPTKATQFLDEQKIKIREDLLTQVQSPVVKDQFSFALERNFLSMDQDVKTWQIRQTVDNAKQANAQTVVSAGTKAYESGAAGGSLSALNLAITDVSLAAQTSVDILDKAELDKYQQVGKQQVVLDYATGLIDNNNLTNAKELLKSKEHREILGADGISKLSRAIDQKTKQNLDLAVKRAELKKKDPYLEVGPEAGLISFNYAADPDATNLKSQLLRRNTYISELPPAEKANIPFLRAQEAKEFKTYVDKLPITNTGDFLEWFDFNTPDQDQVAIGKAIYRNTNDSAMAVAITMAADSRQDAELMVRGKRFFDAEYKGKDTTPRTGKSTFLAPSSNSIKEAFELAYPPDTITNPEQRLIAREAAFYHYVGSHQAQGKPFTGELDADLFKKSLVATIGPVVEHNGQNFVSFRGDNGQWVRDDEIDLAINSITADDIERVQGSRPITLTGQDVNIEQLRSGYFSRLKLQNGTATGQYFVMTNTNNYLIDSKTKQPFQINLKAIMKDGDFQAKRAATVKNLRSAIFLPPEGYNPPEVD